MKEFKLIAIQMCCSYNYAIKVNMIKHEEKKPYRYDFCHHSCSQQSDLNKQTLKILEGKKPFKCDICEDGCFRKGCMNRHVAAVHEGKNISRVIFVIFVTFVIFVIFLFPEKVT